MAIAISGPAPMPIVGIRSSASNSRRELPGNRLENDSERPSRFTTRTRIAQ